MLTEHGAYEFKEFRSVIKRKTAAFFAPCCDKNSSTTKSRTMYTGIGRADFIWSTVVCVRLPYGFLTFGIFLVFYGILYIWIAGRRHTRKSNDVWDFACGSSLYTNGHNRSDKTLDRIRRPRLVTLSCRTL